MPEEKELKLNIQPLVYALESMGFQEGVLASTAFFSRFPSKPIHHDSKSLTGLIRAYDRQRGESLEACAIRQRRWRSRLLQLMQNSRGQKDPKLKDASSHAATILVACDIHFKGLNLAGVYLGKADLRGARFIECDLRGVNFRGAYLDHAVFTGSRLEGPDLEGVNWGGYLFSEPGTQQIIGSGSSLVPLMTRYVSHFSGLTESLKIRGGLLGRKKIDSLLYSPNDQFLLVQEGGYYAAPGMSNWRLCQQDPSRGLNANEYKYEGLLSTDDNNLHEVWSAFFSLLGPAAFSPDSRYLGISSSPSGQMILLDLSEMNKPLKETRFSLDMETGQVTALTFASNTVLVTASSMSFQKGYRRQVEFWDITTGSRLRKWEGTIAPKKIMHLAVSEDGQFVAAQWDLPRGLRLWDVTTGKVHTLSRKEWGNEQVTGLAFTRGAEHLVGTVGGLVRTWEVGAAELSPVVRGAPPGAVVSPSGEWLGRPSGAIIEVDEIPRYPRLHTPLQDSVSYPVKAFYQDGWVSMRGDGSLYLLPAKSGEEYQAKLSLRWPIRFNGKEQVLISPNDRWLAFRYQYKDDASIWILEVWDLLSRKSVYHTALDCDDLDFAFRSDDSTLLFVNDGALYAVDLGKTEAQAVKQSSVKQVDNYWPHGSLTTRYDAWFRAFVYSGEEEPYVWDLMHPDRSRLGRLITFQCLRWAEMSANKRYLILVTGTRQSQSIDTVYLWDLETGRCFSSLPPFHRITALRLRLRGKKQYVYLGDCRGGVSVLAIDEAHHELCWVPRLCHFVEPLLDEEAELVSCEEPKAVISYLESSVRPFRPLLTPQLILNVVRVFLAFSTWIQNSKEQSRTALSLPILSSFSPTPSSLLAPPLSSSPAPASSAPSSAAPSSFATHAPSSRKSQ